MIFMIAVIKDEINDIIGFRLLDTNTEKTMETNYKSVYEGIRYGKACIENLEADNNKIKGYNGILSRYPTLDSQLQLIGKSPIIILSSNDKNEFKCCNYKRQVVKISEQDIIKYGKSNGIANGKIVDGHLSAIEGSYKPIDEKIKQYMAKSALLGLKGLTIEKQGERVVLVKADTSITNCVIPNYITAIGNYAFENCRELKEIAIPNGLKIIGKEAFLNCESLESIDIPDSVIEIRHAAFSHCTQLKSIKLPKELTIIYKLTFHHCESLKELEIPKQVMKIQSRAFEFCGELKSINIPQGLRVIEDRVFNGCTKLRNISLPKSIREIGESAFNDCKSIKKLTIPPIREIRSQAFRGCTSLTDVKISTETITIGYSAFYDCKSLKQLRLSRHVKTVDNHAFTGCNNIKLQAPKLLKETLDYEWVDIEFY